MLSSEAERCALIIVEAAAEIVGLKAPVHRYYSPAERLGAAAQIFSSYGGIANAPLVKQVLDSYRAWSDDPENKLLRELFDRHAELAYRNYCTQDRPAPGRMISDELLREIDRAMRLAETRLAQVAASGEWATNADILAQNALTHAIQKLEHYSEASRVPDLVKAEERA